jgi:hypothetical protein
VVTTTNLGTVDFNWAVLGRGDFLYPSSNQPGQMLMDYAPTGTMTLWWVDNGQLTGIDLGQKWINVGLVATSVLGEGSFNPYRGLPEPDFFASNLTDHHLYDWWIGLDSKLEGIDLGPYWSNVQLFASGPFRGSDFDPDHQSGILVQNTLDHHLYDWWTVYAPSSPQRAQLAGVDLGAVGSNVTFVSLYPSLQQLSFLVANTVDHHLYDWWISNNTLQGIDLGPYWSNVQFVAHGLFDVKTSGIDEEFLVQNTVDHHLYEWWVTPQGQLAGIDLGPYWANIQLVGTGYYNVVASGTFDDLLVRNTLDGHFYEWWIANNQLQGLDLGTELVAVAQGAPSSATATGAASLATSTATAGGRGPMSPVAPMLPVGPASPVGPAMASPAIDASLPSPSSDSTPLLVQAMASFGASDAVDNATGALPGSDPSQQPNLATTTEQHPTHA